jgi:ABC-2 type transport system ATP-binding protein
MSDDIVIKVDNVSKTFKLPHEKTSSLKSAVINFYHRNRTFEKQLVLKDISFEVKKGEFFGIVGRNGSGKSTLLKLLAGIYSPDSGTIQIDGRLTPFIELGVGFSPELTGRENVFLNGALLGFNRKEMQGMYKDIVKFAELERFMDQKLKNYSSGMQVRLAFSIAVRANTAILLIDEVLAVGDVNFQQKCYEYFYKLKREGRTIVFISHDMDSVQRFCDRAMLVNDGKMLFSGKPSEAAILYKRINFDDGSGADPKDLAAAGALGVKSKDLQIELTDSAGKPTNTFTPGQTMTVRLNWKNDSRVQFLGVAIHRDDGLYVFGPNNVSDKRAVQEGHNKAEYKVKLNIGTGQYYVEVAVFGKDDSDKVYYNPQGPSFSVHNPADWQGITELDHEWIMK